MRKVRIGFVGVGNISGTYLKNLTTLFRDIEIAGVCDLIRERAETAAETYRIPKVYDDMYALFADPDVDIVLNITQAYNHYAVTKAALEYGKNVYSEKPLAPTFEQAKELFDLAQSRGLLLGGAPDTFMGAGIQSARRYIDAGLIGTPLGAEARMITHGPESWHPDPAAFYQPAAGPMLDMGPYYVTTLINLLGRVDRVAGMARASFPERVAGCEQRRGERIPVDVPTHVNGILSFENGAVAHLLTTFDVYHPQHSAVEIYGSEGTLFVPNPNNFSGEIQLRRGNEDAVLPLLYGYRENVRGLGLADMARGLLTGRERRADGVQQLHVVEVMTGILRASEEERTVKITTPFERRAPMAAGLPAGMLD